MGIQDRARAEMARREIERRKGVKKQSLGANPNIIEEMHEDVSAYDRAVVKNFSQDPEKSQSYLKKQYPHLDIRNFDGRIIMKDKEQSDWKALDPDTGFFSTDILNDAGDIVYDVGSGIAEGAALAGGTVATTPIGGIAASAATGAASEAARQGIGSMLGIDNELGQGAVDTLTMGALSGAVPGIGHAITPGLKAMASGAKKAAPKILGMIGNPSEESIETLMKSTGDVKRFEKDGLTPFISSIQEGVEDAVLKEGKESGEQTAKIIGKAGNVDITEAQQPILDRISDLQKTFDKQPNPVNKANLEDAVESYNKFFGVYEVDDVGNMILNATEELSPMMDGTDAWKLQQEMRGVSKTFNKRSSGLIERHNKSSSVADQRTANSFAESESKINKVLSNATDGESSVAKRRYQLNKEIQKEIAPKFKSAEATERTLRTLQQPNNKIKRELFDYLDNNYGTGVIRAANKVKMFDTFGSQAKGVTGLDTANITQQTPLSGILGGLGGIVGWSAGSGFSAMAGAAAGQALGKKLSSPKAIRKYVEGIIRTDKYMKVLDKKTKKYMKEELFKKINRGDGLRELIKTSAKASKDRG